MKNYFVFYFCLVALSLPISAQHFSKNDFFYTVPLKLQDNFYSQGQWWHEYLDVPQRTDFLQSILDIVDSGKVTVCYPSFPYSEKMSIETVDSILHRTDTLYPGYGYWEYDWLDTIPRVEHHDLSSKDIHSISFHEEWIYDSIGKTLIKNVKGIILNFDYDPAGMGWLGAKFYIPFDGKGSSANNSKVKEISGFTYDFHTSDFANFSRSSNELFTDDTCMQEKCNAEVKMLVRTCLAGKKLKLYDTLYPYCKIIDKKILAGRMPICKTATAIRFYEDWSVDLNKMTFIKTVHGVVLEKQNEIPDPDGTRVSFSPYVFVPLNGFVPSPQTFPNQVVVPNFIYREYFFVSLNSYYGQRTVFTDSLGLSKMCVSICDLAESQKLPAFEYDFLAFNGEGRKYYSKHYLDSLFNKAHAAVLNPELSKPENNFWEIPFFYQNVDGLGFRENWTFCSSTQKFEKKIYSVTLIADQLVGWKEAIIPIPLFCVDLPQIKDTLSIMKPEFLIGKNIQSLVLINHILGFRDEYGHDPHTLIDESAMEQSMRYNFIQQIISAGLQGKIKIYDGANTNLELTPIQLRTKIDSLKDSTFFSTDLPTDYLLFQEIIFVEDWYFNPATGEFYKKVNGLIFVNTQDDPSDFDINLNFQKRIFSIKLN